MAMMSVLMNIRYWVFAAIIIALIVGDIGGANDPEYLIASLMILMCFSLTGLRFKKDDFTLYRKKILFATLCSSGIATVITLAVGMMYDPSLWGGWVLLACVPSGITTISATLLMKGDVKLVILSTTTIYILAIGLTPLLTYILMGNAIDPLNFIKYVLLFILIPLIVSHPLGKMNIPKNVNSVIINICFSFMVFISFSKSRDVLFSEPLIATLIALGCVVRIAFAHLAAEHIMRKAKIQRADRVPYCLLLVWRNSGLAMTLAMLLLPDVPGAMLPPAISMIFEVFYFMFMMWFYENKVPLDDNSENKKCTAL